MPKGKKYSFFLGANSPRGFYSAFDSLTDDKAIDRVFIIKGGPGCGKSSFMKKLGLKLIEAGADTEFIYCSSDPDSLDGIISPSAKTVICDGTAPHIIEPKYPAALENYLNFGDFWDSSLVRKHYDDIRELSAGIKQSYRRAYGFLSAACKVSDEMFATILPFSDTKKIEKRTKGIITREITNKGACEGVMKKRFLSSVSPYGVLLFSDMVSALFHRVYRISDTYGLSHFMLAPIAKAACAAGHDTYACYCPLNPEGKIDHVLIPDLSLAFVTVNDNLPYSDNPDRHIRLDAYIDHDRYLEMREGLRRWEKTFQSLLQDAINSVAQSKELHDKLETYYVPAVDFSKIDHFFEDFCPKLLDQIGKP